MRGSFGDPRTIFAGPPNQRTLLSGSGQFTFHAGIDISAPDGTAVYPVESGTVRATTAEWVSVDCGGGVSFKYWHVTPAVSAGQHVEADATVLGHIIRGTNHVHLTEYSNGVEVNPLAPGHLGPYTDSTKPTVGSIEFRTSVVGDDLMPEFLSGRIVIVASAYDMPTMRVPSVWHDLPVTPALVEWRSSAPTPARSSSRRASPTTYGSTCPRRAPSGTCARAERRRTCPCSASTTRTCSRASSPSCSLPRPRHPAAAERRLRARRHRNGHPRQPARSRSSSASERRVIAVRMPLRKGPAEQGPFHLEEAAVKSGAASLTIAAGGCGNRGVDDGGRAPIRWRPYTASATAPSTPSRASGSDRLPAVAYWRGDQGEP